MNQVVEEMLGILEGDENVLMHYGMPRRSGRYPWGSGKDPYQRTRDFLSRVEELKKNGWQETAENIKETFGLTSGQYRAEISICKDQRRMADVATAKRLRDKEGLNTSEIGRRMGKNESTIRNYFNEDAEKRMMATKSTVDLLRKEVNEKGMIDVGAAVNLDLGISQERLNTALYYLQTKEGYEVYGNRFDQINNAGNKTTQRVLCVPGTPHSAIYDLDKIQTINDYVSHDGGETFDKRYVYPKSMDSKRLMIRYADDVGPDGFKGIDKDGIVELRRGVDDLSLGESRYSQVRILVDDNYYIKGMAVYSDNMPPGIDVVFNTNKGHEKSKLEVLKPISKTDPDNPFGSLIKDGIVDPDKPGSKEGGQSYYYDKNGNKQLSLINKRADEGDWTDWKDTLPSQFLGKQNISLAKKQLDLAKADKQDEYDTICSLENPTIKKYYLDKFASSCDAAAVDLKAAALPGQKYHVIIPVNSLSDREIYAPRYEDGTKLALVRYPHGGTFEIPILTVNNKNKLAREIIGEQSADAVGINKKIADRLSGADFDGDTVMTIPTHDPQGKVKITSTDPNKSPAFKRLEGFDPKLEYHEEPGMKYMKVVDKNGKVLSDNTQKEMGSISNLITDMTLAGASDEEKVRAVKHSMVVIDAGKHKLNFKQSEIDNNIAQLKHDYQVKIDENGNVKYGGASTILSRSSGEATVLKRQGTPKINMKGKDWYDPSRPEGALIYKTADDLYYPVRKYDKKTGDMTVTTLDGKKVTYNVKDQDAVNKYTPTKRVDPDTGAVTYTSKDGSLTYKIKARTQASTNMAETDDAYTLVSKARHPMELVYADYANSMKAMANNARIELMNTGKITYSKEAKAQYKNEVQSLMAKLNEADKNKIRERAAQRKANVELKSKMDANPEMTRSDQRKAGQQAINKYRQSLGSVKRRDRNIKITDDEWKAIQAGAVSENTLWRILNNSDPDSLRARAMPKTTKTVSQAKINRIKALSASNYTLQQIADKLGLSVSTVSNYL